MSESGLWSKGVAFALTALVVLMLFSAAVTLSPTADAAEAKYFYVPDHEGTNQSRIPLSIGESYGPFPVTISISWGGNIPTWPRQTTMNDSACWCNGYENTASFEWTFEPETFTLDVDHQTQVVQVTVKQVAGTTEPSVNCPVKAWEIPEDPPLDPELGQGTGCNVFITAEQGEPGSGGCFIATAAYGTESAAEIDVLRAFRDDVLLENAVGSQLVEWYYQTSPPVADFISENDVLKALVRELVVDPVASLVEVTGSLWQH